MCVAETPQALQLHILDMLLGTPEATASGALAAVFGQRVKAGEEFNRLVSAFLEKIDF